MSAPPEYRREQLFGRLGKITVDSSSQGTGRAFLSDPGARTSAADAAGSSPAAASSSDGDFGWPQTPPTSMDGTGGGGGGGGLSGYVPKVFWVCEDGEAVQYIFLVSQP